MQAFRLRGGPQMRKFALKGLDPKARYELTDPYTNEKTQAGGAELTSEGLAFDLPEMSSRVLICGKSP